MKQDAWRTFNETRPPGAKVCSRCGVNKPRSEYHKSTKHEGGVSHICKPCRREYRHEWYEGTKDDTVRRNQRSISAVVSPTASEIAWAAGFLEGDGYFLKGPAVGASQVEWFPIVKLIRMFGGLVRPVKPRKPTQNWYVEWEANGARARGVMFTLYPFLSPKRQAQIRKVL